jgi:hypothetical protein
MLILYYKTSVGHNNYFLYDINMGDFLVLCLSLNQCSIAHNLFVDAHGTLVVDSHDCGCL